MPEARIWEKLRRLRLDFEEKYSLQETNWHFLFEELAKFQNESSWIACEITHSIWDNLGYKAFNIESHFPENLRRLSLKLGNFKKALRRFWGSDLDLFKKVEPHLKIEPSYKKKWV